MVNYGQETVSKKLVAIFMLTQNDRLQSLKLLLFKNG